MGIGFCQEHWDGLREAIIERGMGDLIGADAKRAIAGVVDEMTAGKRTLTNFDPLMAAHWAIAGRVIEIRPQILLGMEAHCPICYANLDHAASCPGPPACELSANFADDWIPSVADFMLMEWERLKAEA